MEKPSSEPSRNEALAKQGFHPHVDGTVEERPEEPEVPLEPQVAPEEQTSSGLHS